MKTTRNRTSLKPLNQATKARRRSGKSWLLAGLGLLLSSVALQADDTFATAIEIQPGEVSAALSPVGDVDYFKFAIPSAQVVTIATKASAVGIAPTKLGFQLFDSSGSLIGSSAAGQEPADPNLTKLLQPGTYYVKTQSLFQRTGAYQLLLRTQSSAIPITDVAHGNLDLPNDWKTYRFSVASPGYIKLQARRPSISTPSINLTMVVRDEVGNQLKYATGSGATFEGFLNPGNYFVTITSNFSGDFSLKLTEPGNAISISDGTTRGAIDVPMDQDYYRFVVPGKDSRVIRFRTSGSTYMSLMLLNENGKSQVPIHTLQNDDFQMTLEPGVYFVLLSGYYESGAGSYGDYSLALSGLMPAVPEISVQQPARSELVDGRSKRSFGTAVAGAKNGITKTFVIRNIGGATLKGIKISTSGKNAGDFKIKTSPPSSLAAGKQATFKVTFAPKAKGAKSAGIRISSNDKDENPFDIPVAGKAVIK